ncbi:MAG: TonB-dependent receptor [Myxococcota bacterium]|nr:TonB-dependent receptor [Myxococcota bacterium]
MGGLRKHLIGLVGLIALWGPDARAEGEPSQGGNDETTTTTTGTSRSDAELLELAEGEAIEIFDERPDKPFDRDTEVRLTGEELAARGAVDLGSALALIPEVTVRDGGRGGFNVDIRGGRKGAVSILIDGVSVSDPYYGTFDVSTIPITDIVQIRVSTTPKSPIDGLGGPAGVIEVLTRDAIGPQVVVARLLGDSLPSFGISGTARVALARHLALRISASGLMGARDLELPGDATIGEGRRAATGAARLEYRRGDRRIVGDAFLDDRHYISPPSDVNKSGTILMIDRETTMRVSAKADDKIGKLQLQAQTWAHALDRRSRYFADPTLDSQAQLEDLSANRFGGMALATQPFWKDFRWAASTTVDHESARVSNMDGATARGDVTLVNLALDAQYERKRFRIDVAGGVAVPAGIAADPWPEAKIVGKYRPVQHLELTATTGYKGRVPSLRERFDLVNGNPELGPEQALHAEVRAIGQRDGLRLEAAPFYRRTTGTVRASTDPADMNLLVNLGELDFYGLDLQGKITIAAPLEAGGSYGFIRAKSADSNEPLDRLPHHRADAWAQITPWTGISALVRARYIGPAIDRAMVTEQYVLLEATARAVIAKDYLAVLKVDDATDVRPETRAGFHTPGRTITVVFQGMWQ